MRSTLIAVFTSFVLAASVALVAPTDAESKGKWPMIWKSDDKNWSSGWVLIGNRPGLYQHNILAFTVKKKPGSDRCVAKFSIRKRGVLMQPLRVTSDSRRPETHMATMTFKIPDSWSRRLWGRFGVKTNGDCEWRLRVWGPRQGKP
jgi:hypothetical protein